ncbi:MAG: hypothetical protein ACPHF4_15895, partial [Rubripirellula sp.]
MKWKRHAGFSQKERLFQVSRFAGVCPANDLTKADSTRFKETLVGAMYSIPIPLWPYARIPAKSPGIFSIFRA